MNPPKSPFQARVEALVAVAGGRKPLARRFGVTDSAIKSWIKGSKPVEGKLLTACKRTHISLDWLKHGRGSAEAEMAKVAPRPYHYEEEAEEGDSPRFTEESPVYGETNGGWSIVARILAARLNSKQIAESLKEILDNDEIEEGVIKAASKVLNAAQLPKLNR